MRSHSNDPGTHSLSYGLGPSMVPIECARGLKAGKQGIFVTQLDVQLSSIEAPARDWPLRSLTD